MARRRRQGKAKRDISTIANRRLRSPNLFLRPLSRPFADRRLFHPGKLYSPALTFGGRKAVHRMRPMRNRNIGVRSAPMRFREIRAFDVPARVAVCARRKERREVMIAKGRGGGRKHHKRSLWSDVRC